jgi:hypothetical protein
MGRIQAKQAENPLESADAMVQKEAMTAWHQTRQLVLAAQGHSFTGSSLPTPRNRL